MVRASLLANSSGWVMTIDMTRSLFVGAPTAVGRQGCKQWQSLLVSGSPEIPRTHEPSAAAQCFQCPEWMLTTPNP